VTSSPQAQSCWLLCNKISSYSCCVIKRCTTPRLVPPLSSCCLSLVAPHHSRHAIPLLSRFASLVASLHRNHPPLCQKCIQTKVYRCVQNGALPLARCTSASLVMLSLSCCAAPFTSRHPSLVALCLSCRLSPFLLPLLSPLITPDSARNKVGCCVIKRCTPASPPRSVHCGLSRHAASLLLRRTLHVTPSFSCCSLPILSLAVLCLSCLSSPLSSLVASLVAPHHSPLCQEQGWLLRNKTVHRPLTTLLDAPTAKNGAPPPHPSPRLVHRRLSCHAASPLSRRTLHVTP